MGGEVHPNWSDGQQGRSQLSTSPLKLLYIFLQQATLNQQPVKFQTEIYNSGYMMNEVKKIFVHVVSSVLHNLPSHTCKHMLVVATGLHGRGEGVAGDSLVNIGLQPKKHGARADNR